MSEQERNRVASGEAPEWGKAMAWSKTFRRSSEFDSRPVEASRLDLTRPFTAARARNEGFLALKALLPDIRFVQFIDGTAVWRLNGSTRPMPSSSNTMKSLLLAAAVGSAGPKGRSTIIFATWNGIRRSEASTCGGDALVRVEAFEAVGGFRSELIAGEEPELCLRLREGGWKIWRLDAEMTEHDAAMTRFPQWWLRAVRCGYGYADISWVHRNSTLGIWRRETMRAFIWGAFCRQPLSLGGFFLHPAIFLGALAYPVHICRMALREGQTSRYPSTISISSKPGSTSDGRNPPDSSRVNDFPPVSTSAASRRPCYIRASSSRRRGVTLRQALAWNVGTCRPDEKGEIQAGGPCGDESTDAGHRGGAFRNGAVQAVRGRTMGAG
jgi:GT2 family glycosyltransferase